MLSSAPEFFSARQLILSELKSATAAAHARAELLMPTLCELGDATHYRSCLRSLHAFYAVWEPAVWTTVGVAAAMRDGDARLKVSLLARDLAALRVPPALVQVPSTPRLDCAAALGALYVMEGASLGGRVIARHVARDLALTPDTGLAFFHGYGDDTGARWNTFGLALDAWVARNGHAADVIAGAATAFAALEHWLTIVPPRAERVMGALSE